MDIRQNVVLVMVNKFLKLDENSLSFEKVIAAMCWKPAI